MSGPNNLWTTAEDAQLRALWPTATPIPEIAQRIGRSEGSCKKRAQVLHITGTRHRGPRGGTANPPPKSDRTARYRGTAWTPEEDERLRGLLLSGLSMERVAPMMGRSEAAIDNRAKFFGLARRTLHNGERQWYDPALAPVPARIVFNRTSTSEAAWKDPDRPQPRYSAKQVVGAWDAAMRRLQEATP